MSSNPYEVVFGLPFSAPNLDLLQRVGVAVYCVNIPNADRLAIASGGTLSNGQSATITNLKALYPSESANIDGESQNWQVPYSTHLDGSTKDFYIGSGQMTASQWSRIANILGSPPTGAKYARFDVDSGILQASNVSQLTIGNAYTPESALAAIPLYRFK